LSIDGHGGPGAGRLVRRLGRGQRPLSRRPDRLSFPSTLAPMLEPAAGVNVVGFFRAEFGQGEAARRVVAALERAGMPVSTVTFDRVPHRQDHPFEDRGGKAVYPANILCLNAEHLLEFIQQPERELLRGRSSAGVWFWETSRLPRALRPALDFVDEVWVASPF